LVGILIKFIPERLFGFFTFNEDLLSLERMPSEDEDCYYNLEEMQKINETRVSEKEIKVQRAPTVEVNRKNYEPVEKYDVASNNDMFDDIHHN